MRITAQGPNHDPLVIAFGSDASVRFGDEERHVDIVVRHVSAVGDRPFLIDMPRAQSTDPHAAMVVSGPITGGNFDKVLAVALVTFDDNGTFLCAVIFRQTGITSKVDLDLAGMSIAQTENAAAAWFADTSPSGSEARG